MAVRTYDPCDVAMSFFGYPITGFAEGTFITVERSSDTFTRVVGVCDGSRTRSHDRGGSIEFTVLQTAPINDWLAAMINADERTKNVIGPVIVKDNSGNSTYFAAEAWIVSQPSGEFSTDQTGRTYRIETNKLDMFTGASVDTAINEAVNATIAAAALLET
jgi:hypothetical protein